jgi:hypothetical protein
MPSALIKLQAELERIERKESVSSREMNPPKGLNGAWRHRGK